MFESYDTKIFGEKLKELRRSLGFSQAEVSRKTSINIDTIRKIENGFCIPRNDTLVQLSLFYKVDLLKLLSNYQRYGLLFDFYKKIDHLMIYGKFNQIPKLHNEFLIELNQSSDLQLINHIELEQIDCFVSAVSSRYRGDISQALETTCYAISLTNPEFNIEKCSDFRYTALEIRLLVVAAACLGDLRNCELSIIVSEFILSTLNIDSFSDKTEDMYAIKSYANISYNYHRLDNHLEALKYAKKGIELSLNKGHIDMLHFLFLREAVAKLNLGNETYLDSFKKCLYILKIEGNMKHYNYMVDLIKDKYSLDFSEL